MVRAVLTGQSTGWGFDLALFSSLISRAPLYLQSWWCCIHFVSKMYAIWCLLITLENVDQFSKCFYQLIHKKILYVYTIKISTSPHLQYVATLPCDSRKSKSVTDFDSILNKLLTRSWGHLSNWFHVVRQTVSRLLTLSDWLTFWSLWDDISNQQLNVVQLNVVALRWFFHHKCLCIVKVIKRHGVLLFWDTV